MSPTAFEVTAAALFACAVLHTFSTKYFEHLARMNGRFSRVWDALGEVELVFGLWAIVLVAVMFVMRGSEATIAYVGGQRYTEAIFVFTIMIVAGTRPVLQTARAVAAAIARVIPLPATPAYVLVVLAAVPLMGSLITEPAAMTLAALMLLDRVFTAAAPATLKYAVLGVLFVNVSIGGTLTPFAAPPVLMVAAKWNWDMSFMLSTFGVRAVAAVAVNAIAVTLIFRRTLMALGTTDDDVALRVPSFVVAAHLFLLAAVVATAHHALLFLTVLAVFLVLAALTREHHDMLVTGKAARVAAFLGGLVLLGGQQQWWIERALSGLGDAQLFFASTGLTAVVDNAALTYLGSLVPGLTDAQKYALVAGAVTGGGLTIIANAPNPAGVAILRSRFSDGAIGAGALALAALVPTGVAVIAFWFF